MKLATVKNDTFDGRLVVVSKDLRRAVAVDSIAGTMRDALENWVKVEPSLARVYDELNSDVADRAFDFEPQKAMAPLPRAHQFIDASVFPIHSQIMAKAMALALEQQQETPILVPRQGDDFRGPRDDYEVPSEDDQIDFEGEFAVITDSIPMGATATEAAQHIRLLTIFNDVSMRKYIPQELKLGFGLVRAKTASVFAPVAVTPDELGSEWRDARPHLDLHIARNGQWFGNPNGREMAMSFAEILAYIAYNRRLGAGFVLGSGTVANREFRSVGSACIAERRGIEIIDGGQPFTEFLKFGERVQLEAKNSDGQSVFGAIDFKLVHFKK